jgi:Flp pilus assembly protein TadG
MTRWKRMSKQERGSSLTELALILPLLALMVMGIVDLGRAFHDYVVITNASRVGARYASRFPDEGGRIVSAAQQDAANNGLDGLINVQIDTVGANAGESIRVTTSYQFHTFLGGMIGHPIVTLKHTTEMVVFGIDD